MDNAVLKISVSAYGSSSSNGRSTNSAESCPRERREDGLHLHAGKGRVSFSDNDIRELFDFAKKAGFDIIQQDFIRAYNRTRQGNPGVGL